jgi:hypothetical protein
VTSSASSSRRCHAHQPGTGASTTNSPPAEAGDGGAATELLDEHLSRARELPVGALGGSPGPEATWPSSVLADAAE